jgi:hypothetical protein
MIYINKEYMIINAQTLDDLATRLTGNDEVLYVEFVSGGGTMPSLINYRALVKGYPRTNDKIAPLDK